MKKNTNQFNVSHADRMNYGGAKFYRFALFPLMLFTLLFVSTRMVAQTTTEDPRYALFNGLDGITDVTITDDGSYPWKMLDLKAEGIKYLGFTIPDGSKGLMSSNFHVDESSSETVIKFKVSKPILLTSQVLVSSKKSWNKFSIYVDNKLNLQISDKKQTEYKVLLSVGEHSLTLHYKKDSDYSLYADRAFLYNLKTSTTIDDYVADYESSNKTMTFKSIKSDNLGALNLNRIAMVNNEQTVSNMCSLLNIEKSAIKNIVFDKSINTYTPTTLNSFFRDLDELQTITDLKYLNTANVTDMSYMFYSCQELSSLDLTNFNTANVTDMHSLFDYCSSLTSLDLTNFNTAKVTYMNNMFEGCSALKSLDLTNFNTANVTNMSNMFYNCQNLSKLDVSNFNTEKLLTMCSMFQKCKNLISLDLSNFNTKSVTEMAKMFSDCSTLQNIYVSENFVTDRVYVDYHMFYGCTNLKDYSDSKVDHTYANYGPDGYFTPGCGYAEYDLSSKTLTFRYKGVKPEGAYDLNEGNNTPEWSTQKEDINKVVFDASFACARPTSCYRWFYGCTNLSEIKGIENLNTEKVTNMGFMFYDCYALTSLDVSKFDTQNVEDMSNMFASCEKLKSLNVSNFNTQNVKNMSLMFYNCIGLTSLDLSKFNTQNVENMRNMFRRCKGLNSLDLSKFDTQNVTDMSYMFWNSSALTTIYVSDKFVTTKVSSGAKMFQGCENLKGFIDYISNKDKDNNEYANYKTGYFSKLVGKNGEKKIGAAGETLTTENLVLDDGKDFVAYEPFATKNAFYIRVIPEGSKWGTLCLPFAIDQSQETECKFYRLTGIDNDNKCITLESCEGTEIPAGTPVLFKMNENEQTLNISVQNAGIVTKPKAGTNTDVNLVGSFTKIGGKDNQGLADTDYIIGKDKFWLVSELDGGNGVGIKPMHAYIHPATASQARAAMLSIGKGDGTTAIDNLNAISNDANAEYYDANGRRTNGLQKGLNIVKRGSKTYKIMVK